MKISVIIPTCNRCEKLRLVLDALKESARNSGGHVEVLIIDNNSSDATPQLLAEYSNCTAPVFRYLLESRQGKSLALNTAIQAATGEILAFTDDDCIPSPDWLSKILKEFEADPKLTVIGGRVELYDKNDISQAVSLTMSRIQISKAVDTHGIVMGGNMAWRRNAFVKLPLFDPLFGPAAKCKAAEDWEILYRIYRDGFKMVYSPEIVVFHNHGRRSTVEEEGQSRSYAIGRGGVYCKHILKLDMGMFTLAVSEVYHLNKTILKRFITGQPCSYHKLALVSLFLGAYYYLKPFPQDKSKGRLSSSPLGVNPTA